MSTIKTLLLTLTTAVLLNAENFTNSLGMEFVTIPAGTFMMGRDAAFEDGRSDELPQHRVRIEKFAMMTTEVTQSQWVKVMGSNPSKFKGRSNPVENVSYYDVQRFIKKLNNMEGTNTYRLPTEAEWEYAARAGSNSTYLCGDDKGCIGSIAWYRDNSAERTHPVAQKQPNRWGLYDMSGNVLEWTSSCHTKNYNISSCDRYDDGVKPKVLRGGSYYYVANDIRVASRYDFSPRNRYDSLGFRLSRTLP
jgi:formylglycine-generating enzyme required for sulfatase activity